MKKKLVYIAIALGILASLVVAGTLLVDTLPKSKQDDTLEVTQTPEIDENYVEGANDQLSFAEKKEINKEYIGELVFDSGLVEQRVVQAGDNDKYLDLSWDLYKNSNGAAFMDYRNSLDDQNLVIYGHYVYADETRVFGPLHELRDEENYEENQIVKLIVEDEIREYRIARVFFYEMGNADLRYFYTNFDTEIQDEHTNANQEYFDKYMATVDKKSFYTIDEELTIEDKWITLQTCVRNRSDLRLIVIAKEISRTPISN